MQAAQWALSQTQVFFHALANGSPPYVDADSETLAAWGSLGQHIGIQPFGSFKLGPPYWTLDSDVDVAAVFQWVDHLSPAQVHLVLVYAMDYILASSAGIISAAKVIVTARAAVLNVTWTLHSQAIDMDIVLASVPRAGELENGVRSLANELNCFSGNALLLQRQFIALHNLKKVAQMKHLSSSDLLRFLLADADYAMEPQDFLDALASKAGKYQHCFIALQKSLQPSDSISFSLDNFKSGFCFVAYLECGAISVASVFLPYTLPLRKQSLLLMKNLFKM